jgi:hypothetical protein
MANLSSRVISEEIRNAQRGSLLHDLVEKIAYRLHLDNFERDADSNWFLAQDYLDLWSCTSIKKYDLRFDSVSDLVSASLETGSRAETKFVDLRYSFAEKIVDDIQSPFSYLFSSAA